MSDRTYEYRFASVGGLERRSTGPRYFMNYAVNGLTGAQELSHPWEIVKGDDFLSMTWEELEHVAHVIRDASRPKTEREAA